MLLCSRFHIAARPGSEGTRLRSYALAACRTRVSVFVRADNSIATGGFMVIVPEGSMLFERAFLAKWNGARGWRPLQAAARAYIRFMFQAIVTRLHSPWTWSRPRRRN